MGEKKPGEESGFKVPGKDVTETVTAPLHSSSRRTAHDWNSTCVVRALHNHNYTAARRRSLDLGTPDGCKP